MRKKISINEQHVIELYNIGMSTTRVADALNVDRSVIRRVLKDSEVQCRQNKVNSIQDVLTRVKKDGTSGCWIWTGCKNNKGYGQVKFNGKTHFTHRLSYYFYFGQLLEGQEICHKCDNPICCNPDHLFLGTTRDNMIDCLLKGRRSASKLNAEKVKMIREMHLNGIDRSVLMHQFNISRNALNDVISGRSWSFVL